MRERRATWLAVCAVLPLAILAVAPFLYMMAVALADPGSFTTALTALPFDRFLLNSVVVTGCVVAAQVLTSAMAAYAFARLRFPGRDRVFVGYLSVLLVPGVALLVPRFLIVAGLGWIDTYQGLISTELVSVWGVFMLRQFFLTIPRDLEDAARLEGAGEWTIFWRIVLPLSRPALAALAVLAAAHQWQSFLWPLIATRSTEMRVLEVGLATFHGLHGSWPSQMAAALVAMAPMIVLYVVAQKYFMRGIQLGVGSTGHD
jgi:multiple sugar transport system permease protein